MPYKDNEILLVNPTGGWEQKTENAYFFPTGLLYLQNYLLKHDIPSTIIDVKPMGLSPDNFKQILLKYEPKIIGFTGSPFERHTLHEYIRGVKEYAPDSLVVTGGPYFTATAEDCLTNLAEVDVVVRGEGEITLLELVQSFNSVNNDFGDIDGITYKDQSGNIVTNKNRSPSNRDECEIDINLIRDDRTYTPFVYLKNFEREKVRALPILIARGCVKSCTYCFNNNNGRFKSRSVSSIIEEIQIKREKFKCDYFWMVDPTFTLREKFAYELCTALQKYCPRLQWYCETRADCSLPLLKEMSKAGCVSVDFALESGSPKVLKAIQKDLDPATVIPFARECKKLGIRALVFVMYTLPEETMDDFYMTMNILKKIKPYIYEISFNQTLILPGTKIEKEARRLKLLDDNFSWYDRSYKTIPVWKTLMNDEELNECARLLQHYQYLLHHSKVYYLRKKLKHHCMERLTGNESLVKFVRQRPNFHKFMESKMHWIFGSDE